MQKVVDNSKGLLYNKSCVTAGMSEIPRKRGMWHMNCERLYG